MSLKVVATRIVCALAGVSLVASVPAAQQFVLSSEDRARLVAVDFTAFGPDGLPITDLRPEEVTLKIDGRTRPIRALDFVNVSGSEATSVAAPFGTNVATTDSRAVLLVIDDETLSPGREQELKDAIRGFLGKLGPHDRVALYTVPYGGLKANFTNDPSRIMTALEAVTGRKPQIESETDAGCRSRSSLVALGGALEGLSTAEAPITVVFFTMHLTVPRGVTGLSRGAADVGGVSYMNTIGTCEVLTDHYNQVSAAAAKARAQLFIVQPELSPNNAGRPGLEHLTGQTGAPLWNLKTGNETALDRIATQTSGYYLARIEPDPQESADVVRGYSVSVNRPNVTVRHRPQLQVKRPGYSAPAGAKPTTTMDMMREARLFTELPLRVSATASRNSDGSIKAVALLDSPGTAALTSVMVGLFDDTGRLVASSNLTPAELTRSPIVAALTAPAGEYRLRVAAMDSQNRAGAADTDLSLRLTQAGPVQLSGLVLGQSRAEGFSPKLEFTNEATALAMLELYGAKAGTPVGVAFEIASTMNGPAFATMPGAFAATSEPDRFVVTAAIPVGALKPGDYAIRAIVAVKGEAGGRVVRTLRKTAPPAK